MTATATQTTPSAPKPRLAKEIRRALNEGDNEYALKKAKAAQRDFPDEPRFLGLMAEAYLAADRIGKAEAALEQARQAGLGQKRELSLALQIAKIKGDHGEVVKAGKRLVDEFGQDDMPTNIALVDALLFKGLSAEALHYASILFRNKPENPRARKLKLRALMANNSPDELIDAVEHWIFEDGGGPRAAKVLIGIGTHTEQHRDRAIHLMNRALEMWPDSGLTDLFQKATYVRLSPDGRRVQRGQPVRTDLSSEFERHGIRALILLLEDTLPSNSQDFEAGEIISQILSDLEHAPMPRPLIRDFGDQDVIVSDPGPARQTAVVFTGGNGRSMLPIQAFDAYLASLGIRSIFIRDANSLAYLHGIASLGADLAASRRGLADLIGKTAPDDEVFTIGFSLGGYGALQFLGAYPQSRLLLFSPATSTTASFIERTMDFRLPMMFQKIQRLCQDQERDCRVLLEANSPPPPISIFFNSDNRVDRLHAENIAGVENVEIIALEGAQSHNSLNNLIMREQMFEALTED